MRTNVYGISPAGHENLQSSLATHAVVSAFGDSSPDRGWPGNIADGVPGSLVGVSLSIPEPVKGCR